MVLKMQESGFCYGVRNAVDKAMQYENEIKSKQVVLLGNLVNNNDVMQRFVEKGYIIEEDVRAIPEGAIVIIRAHGVSIAVYEELKKKKVVIEDCTCEKIQKIHNIVAQKSADGYKIVVIGKKKHPEVIGSAGWSIHSPALVVENESDLEDMDLTGKICVVAQTTYNRESWKKIVGQILKINPSCEVNDTLCNVTKIREEKARRLAQEVDTMVVLGDRSSSNSKELYTQCCLESADTFFVGTLSDIQDNAAMLDKVLQSVKVGLTGSTSVSDEVIADVYGYLEFLDFLEEAKKEINFFFQKYFKKHGATAINNSFVQASWQDIIEQNKGGKRIRGALIKLGELIASRGEKSNYLAAAASYEFFQTSILIHDDIIDKSDTRRKKTTIHVESAKNIADLQGKHISNADAQHYGISRALCIGDYGFFISYQILAECPVDAFVLSKLYKIYSQIYAITCEGEIMDTVLPFTKISISDEYDKYESMVMKIYEYKTAWYTLAGPLMIGAICGGADGELLSVLRDIAIPLGIAFQIKDDLLGVYSSEEVLGKSVLSDIRENKQTILLGIAYLRADEMQRKLIDQHYGMKEADEHDLEIIRKVFEETGARNYAEKEIERLANNSRKLISKVEETYRMLLHGLINYLVGRKC